jgi:RNA polymerase sigma-54 factor
MCSIYRNLSQTGQAVGDVDYAHPYGARRRVVSRGFSGTLSLQPKLNLKVSQRQVLTPGLVQMVSVLALNKLELKEMINSEVVENPVLEEIEDNAQSFEELAAQEGERERSAADLAEAKATEEKKDPFDEIDFGSYFQDYLDPGFKAPMNAEDFDKPSFENFLSTPTTLTDHLAWQLGSMSLGASLRDCVDFVVGNLDENGYLTATPEEMEAEGPSSEDIAQALAVVHQLDPIGVGARDLRECLLLQARTARMELCRSLEALTNPITTPFVEGIDAEEEELGTPLDTSSMREALLIRLNIVDAAIQIIDCHLALLEKRDLRDIAKQCGTSQEIVQHAIAFIRTLDPRPGQRYNLSEARLIEPDVAFVKRDDDFVVVMNEEDMPALRLNAGYRRMLRQKETEKEVREYVKERYRSAIQLLRNIEQRKNTIVRTCEVIVRRQRDFLERGVDALHPMMIKEVAEEIGVHPSTVSRAVANKYVFTAQGVYELRFFFTEGVNGPEGGDLPLLLLKKKVRALIDAEDPQKPLTDDALAAELSRQGIQVNRRTVAKYREDMQIPSTHRRRRRD